MQKLFISKHKNGYYYIYYIDLNGKRKSITTKIKVKSKALKALSNFDKMISSKKNIIANDLTLKQFRWKFLKHSESYHSWKTTLDYKSTFNEMEELCWEERKTNISRFFKNNFDPTNQTYIICFGLDYGFNEVLTDICGEEMKLNFEKKIVLNNITILHTYHPGRTNTNNKTFDAENVIKLLSE
mgnify:CR=1 FL=1